MSTLPSLRRQIRRKFFVFILLYTFLGIFLVISMLASSGTSPKMIHVNYDSISAANRMKEAWVGLITPFPFDQHSPKEWMSQFEKALKFEENNITEPGELEATQRVRENWEKWKSYQGERDHFLQEGYSALNQILSVNQKGMFELAEENLRLSHRVLIAASLYFFFTLIVTVFLADNLSERLSRPLKEIAEILHQRPSLGKALRLPNPDSLEFLILTTEINYVWHRLSQTAKVNFEDLLLEKFKLETVLEFAEDAVLVVDSDDIVIYFNEELLKLIQLPFEQVRNRQWKDLPAINNNYLRLRDTLQANVGEGVELELSVDNQKRSYSVRSRKMRGIGGHISGSLFLFHDITEKKKRDRFRADFIDLLSQELKTPLQSLGTASEILLIHKQLLPENIKKVADTISEDFEKIRVVANEFVTITQSQSKVLKLKMKKVPIDHLIQEWIKPFYIIAKDHSIRIEFVKEGSEIIWANIDVVKFPWVISNILSNAIRFAPPESTITVFLSDRSNYEMEIQVKDEGPGIPEEDQMRIFDPFFQTNVSGPDGNRGLFGIGLTIAKEVVEAHEGRIEYYRRKPHGSEFRILLPYPSVEFG